MNYNSETLLNVKFKKNVKGYDALEVDTALDKVIDDYKKYEKQEKELNALIEKLEKENKKLTKQVKDDEITIKKLENRIKQIPDNPNVNRSNIDLLKRISVLEQALYKKGVDPSKLK